MSSTMSLASKPTLWVPGDWNALFGFGPTSWSTCWC